MFIPKNKIINSGLPAFHLVFLLFLTTLPPTWAYGQVPVYASFNAGANISYNRLHSDKPLPVDLVPLNRAGFCSDFGLHFRLYPRLSLNMYAKKASIKRGVKAKGFYVKERNPSTGEVISEEEGGMEFISSSPVHLQAGASVYPIVGPQFEWSIGAAFGPVLFKNELPIPISFEMDYEDLYLFAFLEDERKRRTGWVYNLNTSLAYKFNNRSAFILTLNYNKGIDDVFEYKSSSFIYHDRKSGVSERYNVRLLNNGSYNSCTIGFRFFIVQIEDFSTQPLTKSPRYNF